jgi:hypothetical protein
MMYRIYSTVGASMGVWEGNSEAEVLLTMRNNELEVTCGNVWDYYIEEIVSPCIMVDHSDSGTYQHIGAAEVEDWDEVVSATDRQEKYANLVGWDPWNEVWRVENNDEVSWYFRLT